MLKFSTTSNMKKLRLMSNFSSAAETIRLHASLLSFHFTNYLHTHLVQRSFVRNNIAQKSINYRKTAKKL